MNSVRVIYDGRVQGVGFRWTVKNLAKEFEVAGTAENLAVGRVEVIVQGDDTEDFLEAIRKSVLAGHIENEQISNHPRIAELRGFLIIP